MSNSNFIIFLYFVICNAHIAFKSPITINSFKDGKQSNMVNCVFHYQHNKMYFNLWSIIRQHTLICLFSSLSRCTSIWSLLHSSMILFTSASPILDTTDFTDDADESDFGRLEDTILLLLFSCCWQLCLHTRTYTQTRVDSFN